MKIKLNNKYVCWGVTALLVIIGGILFYYFMFHSSNIRAAVSSLMSILMPIIVGMALAYLLTPVMNYLERKFLLPLFDRMSWKESPRRKKFTRALGILITTALLLLVIYLLFYMLISQIVPSVENIINNFDSYVNNFTSWASGLMRDNPEMSAYFSNMIDKYSGEFEAWIMDLIPHTSVVIKTISSSVVSIISALWNFVIGFIISIYVLASKEKFTAQAKKAIYALFETDSANIIIRNIRFANDTFVGFLGGKIVDSIIIGLLCYIGTTILQTPYSALVSVIVGVTNIIPFFGPYIGAIPSVLLIFMVDPLHPLNCVYFILFILLLQQFDGNILGPKILGSSTGLTGFWVIFAITLFGGLMGVLGMIIGVPFFAVIYAGIRAFFNIKLQKKGLPIEAYRYEHVEYIDQNGFHEPVPSATPVKKERGTPKTTRSNRKK
ncbi:MAG: AI-2E family transporter [Acetatifactor sp.]